MPLEATWMDLEIIILSEVRQGKTNIYTTQMKYLIFKKCKWTYLLNRRRLIDIENKPTVTMGKHDREGQINQELGMNTYTLLCMHAC